MNTRRSFFQRCATLIATLAIAPEIAFRVKLALPAVTAEPVRLCNSVADYEAWCEASPGLIDFWKENWNAGLNLSSGIKAKPLGHGGSV